jgi:hypothetical protein
VSGVIGVATAGIALQEEGDGALILAPVAIALIVVSIASTALWLVLGVRRDLRRRPGP